MGPPKKHFGACWRFFIEATGQDDIFVTQPTVWKAVKVYIIHIIVTSQYLLRCKLAKVHLIAAEYLLKDLKDFAVWYFGTLALFVGR